MVKSIRVGLTANRWSGRLLALPLAFKFPNGSAENLHPYSHLAHGIPKVMPSCTSSRMIGVKETSLNTLV